MTKYFPTSQTEPSTPFPCNQLLVSWELFCQAPGGGEPRRGSEG